TGPGLRIMYQDVALEPGASHTLQVTLYYRNLAAGFSNPPSLSPLVIPNQQYRIDVMKPTAPITSAAPSDILATALATKPGDPLTLAPSGYSTDLTAFAGQTVRLRFGEVDNRGFFHASVDNVRIITTAPVAIDIKPGELPNAINPNGQGAIPVAILST